MLFVQYQHLLREGWVGGWIRGWIRGCLRRWVDGCESVG